MGGTSCDVCLIVDGEPLYSSDFEIEFGLPVSVPSVSTTHDRRRRRLDRLGRPRRVPAGRPAERGRRSRARLLRPRRRGRDDHRRERRPRPPRPGLLPRRPAARSTPSAARRRRSTGSATRSGVDRRRVGLGDGAGHEREHGERDPHRHRRAGHRPARVRAGRVRRRRADARRGDRRRDRHAPRARAAQPGPLLRLRHARRAACASTPCGASTSPTSARRRRSSTASSTSSRSRRAPTSRPRAAAAPQPRCAARSRCATRARTTSRRSRCRRDDRRRRRCAAVFADYHRLLRGVLRLPARRRSRSSSCASAWSALGEPSRCWPVRPASRGRRRDGRGRRATSSSPATASCRRPWCAARRSPPARGARAARSSSRWTRRSSSRPPGARRPTRRPAGARPHEEEAMTHGRHRPGHPDDHQQQLREHLPRDGHHDDAHGLLADLQRGPRLLVRALRPATAT